MATESGGGREDVHLIVPVSGRVKRQIAALTGVLLLLGVSVGDVLGWLREHPELWKYIGMAVVIDLLYLTGQYVLDVKREKNASILNGKLIDAAASRDLNTVRVTPPATPVESSVTEGVQ
jgi:hypothetical protein